MIEFSSFPRREKGALRTFSLPTIPDSEGPPSKKDVALDKNMTTVESESKHENSYDLARGAL